MTEQYTLEYFLTCRAALLDGNEEELVEAIGKIRRASCNEESPSLDLIIQADIVPILITFHKDCELENVILQDIVWTLANLSSGDKRQTMYMVQQGGVEYFIEFVDHKNEDIYSQALWGLANIGGESARFRDYLLEKGVMEKTLEVYFDKRGKMEPETRKTVAWLINNLCRSKPAVQFDKVKECLPYLETSLKDIDREVITENLWACAYITEIDEEAVQAVIDQGIMEQVVFQFKKNVDKSTIIAPALKACSNVVATNEEITDRLINLDIIPVIFGLLSSDNPIIRKEACYFFSNVAAGSPSQINAIFERPEFLPKLVAILRDDEPGILNEAAWIVANSIMGNTGAHARRIINSDVFVPVFKRIDDISQRAQVMVAQAFREVLNHVMDMTDTPPLILSLIKFYKENVKEYLIRLKDNNLSIILVDIDNLISDVLENA